MLVLQKGQAQSLNAALQIKLTSFIWSLFVCVFIYRFPKFNSVNSNKYYSQNYYGCVSISKFCLFSLLLLFFNFFRFWFTLFCFFWFLLLSLYLFSRFLGRNSLSALKVLILVFILVFLLRPKDLKKKYVNQVYSLTSGYCKDVLWLRKQ